MKNILFVLWLKKCAVVQCTMYKTCTVDVCHRSVFKLKYSQGSWRFLSLTENPKNCSLRSLPNMELLDKLKGQIPLKISKIFCRYSLIILMEKDATLKIYQLVKTLWTKFCFWCIALYPVLQSDWWICPYIMQ